MAITCAGDRFETREEQDALMKILEKTEKEHAWPTASARGHLREAWGWGEAMDEISTSPDNTTAAVAATPG